MPKTVDEIKKELADAIVERDGGITNENAAELLALGKATEKHEPGIKMVKKTILVTKDGNVVDHIDIDVPLEGFVESVGIAATLNLGNYNNVRIEVSASNGDMARFIFEQESKPTIDLVKGIIKTINAK